MTIGTMRVGFDLVLVKQIESSIARFGERFLRRLFTQDELTYCGLGTILKPQRLAARFAAKEAVIKALQLAEEGIGWTDIEVVKLPGQDCSIVCHGRAASVMHRRGAYAISVSLSHEGDYAGACVIVQFSSRASNIF